VDRLVEDSLVERATPREDRRQVVLTVTEVGRTAYLGAVRAIFGLNRELLSGLGEDDQRRAAHALEAVLAQLVDDPALRERLLLRHERPSR